MNARRPSKVNPGIEISLVIFLLILEAACSTLIGMYKFVV